MSLNDKIHKALSKVRPEPRPNLLLCPPIPKPMHRLAPRVILGKAWWEQTRQEAYRSTRYHCLACGVWKHQAKCRQWLEGHEVYEIDFLLGRMEYLETVPLCHYCHNYIHIGRLTALLDKGQIVHSRYTAIIQHGDSVLMHVGLKRLPQHTGPTAEWEDWRLILFGKEYPPKYKTFEDWKVEFNGN